MAGQEGEGARARIVAGELLERPADAAVKRLAVGLGQAGIGRLLHEPVPEAVLGIGPPPLLEDQLEPLQLRERAGERLGIDHPLEERHAEAAADHRGDRDRLAGGVIEPVEAGLEDALHERRHLELVGRDRQLPAAVDTPDHAPLDQIAQRLGHEKRVAAGPLGDQIGDGRRERGVGQRLRERVGRLARERPKLNLYITVRVSLPGVLSERPRRQVALAAVEQDDPERLGLGELQQLLHRLESELVGPVQILEDDEERPLLGQPLHELGDHLEAAPVQGVAAQLMQLLDRARIGLLQAEEVGQERIALVAAGAEELVQGRLQVEPHPRLAGGRRRAEPIAQQVADRPVGEPLGVAEAAADQQAHAVAQRPDRIGHQAGLADAGLAGHRHDHPDAVHHPFEGGSGRGRARRRGRPGGCRPAGRGDRAHAPRGRGRRAGCGRAARWAPAPRARSSPAPGRRSRGRASPRPRSPAPAAAR